MVAFLKLVFAEQDGSPSSMRVMSFEIVQVALAIAMIEVVRMTLSLDSIGLVMGLLAVAFTGKVIQKGKEGPQ